MTRLTDDGGSARQARLEDLFSRVMDLAPEERGPILARECEGDADLRTRLERLLAAHDGAERVIPTPPIEGLAPDSASFDRDPLIGETVGMFRVERQVGAGGMGAVYEATQESPKRRVALKVMRAGLVAKGAAQRFRAEAEALGALEHPHIARIYEAGVALTKVGRLPYFAMEFISGRALLEHAKARSLNIPSRVALLVSVCDAVEHAHRRGIIHRDLKPANILVTDDSEPKVLDFGVARLTASDLPASSLHTEAGQLLGTLQYMSPEQASGDPLAIDTRSDVYSLGVVLYELLAGVLPYDVSTSTLLQAAQIIREHDPRPLGDVVPELRGDLETITRKAIEKRPEMRYQAAGELAADLRRFLRHEPISARPPSATYYLRKFVRRNKALSIGAAATLLTLLLGVVGTSIGLKRAVDAREQADQSAAESALNAAKSEINEYIANIQAASASMRAGDLGTARARLDASNEKFRAWEWNLAHAQLDQCTRTLRSPGDSFVAGLALSREESLLAATVSSTLAIYDARTGKLLRSRSAEELTDQRFGHVAWSPDGTRLAVSLTYARKVAIIASDTLLPTLLISGFEREVTGIDWSPDGSCLAIGSGHWSSANPIDRVCSIHRTDTGEVLHTIPDLPARIWNVRWSPDGTLLLMTTEKGVTIARTDDWSCRTLPRDARATSRESGAVWSPDGRRFLVSQSDRITVFDRETFDQCLTIPMRDDKVVQALFSADGASLLLAMNDGITMLNSATGAFQRRLRGIEGSIFVMVPSSRHPRLWTGDSSGAIKEWDLDSVGDMLEVQAIDTATPTPDFSLVIHPCPEIGRNGSGPLTVRDGRTGTPLREFFLGDAIDQGSALAISPDGRYAIRTQFGPFLSVSDLQTGQHWERRVDSGGRNGISVCTPDAKFLLHNIDSHLRCFSLPELEPSTAWRLPNLPFEDAPGFSELIMAPDGRSVAMNLQAGRLQIVHADGKVIGPLTLFDEAFSALAFSPNGRWLVAGSTFGRVALVEAANLRIVARLNALSTHVPRLRFDTTSSRVFAAQRDGTIRILGLFTLPDSPDPRLIEVSTLRAGAYWIEHLYVSNDGTRLMAATAWPANRYFVWDARSQASTVRTILAPN